MRSILRGLALSLGARPARAGELRDDVLSQLSGIEAPPSAQSLAALGPNVVLELMELAQDDTIPRSKRARALHALGWFPSDGTRAFLRVALAGDDALMRRKAVYALGMGWNDEALPDIDHALSNEDDVQLRIAAAKALGQLGTPASQELLEHRLSVEPNPTVQTTIRKALGQHQ